FRPSSTSAASIGFRSSTGSGSPSSKSWHQLARVDRKGGVDELLKRIYGPGAGRQWVIGLGEGGGPMVGRKSWSTRVTFAFTIMALVATACGGGTKSPQGQAGGGGTKPCLKEAFVFVLPMNIPGWTGAAADSIPLLKQKYPCVETRAL